MDKRRKKMTERLIKTFDNMTDDEHDELHEKAKKCEEAQMKEYGFVQRIVL